MKLAILAAVAAATLVGSAPAAMAQPYWHHHWRHHYWHHHWFGHRHFCYHHPYRC